ncbi:MAG TPA: hypothetical protein VGR45_01585 [Stellaceae bacterium]|nr:hypothetical protein [Stellaceae bacterium]
MLAALASIRKPRDLFARRRMPTAVADHGVGKRWRKGMAMSLTGEIAIPCNEENRIRNLSLVPASAW